jgi:hypothetical protein
MLVVSAAARHIFWTPPVRQELFGHSMPVVNLGSAGLRMSRFLGQPAAPAPPPGQPNRLALIPVDMIRDRNVLLWIADRDGSVPDDPKAAKHQLRRIFEAIGRAMSGLGGRAWGVPTPVLLWNDEDMRILLQVANGPTADEIRDLALVDAFFGREERDGRGGDLTKLIAPLACTGGQLPRTSDDPALRRLFHEPGERRISLAWMATPRRNQPTTIASNPFFCTPATQVQVPSPGSLLRVNLREFFAIDSREEWGDVRMTLDNSLAFLTALVDYPFPSPISVMPGVWFGHVQGNIREFVHQDLFITPPLARLWVTLAVVTKYNDASAEIVHKLKRDAKRKKRKELIRKIALAATFAVITAGLALALAPLVAPLVAAGIPLSASTVAGGVTGVIQYAMNEQDRKQAAEDLEKVAEQFERDDPAFAAEARKAAETIDYLAAATKRAAELTQEETDAIREGDTESEYTPQEVGYFPDESHEPGLSTETLIVGGGIAAGAAALLVAFLR